MAIENVVMLQYFEWYLPADADADKRLRPMKNRRRTLRKWV